MRRVVTAFVFALALCFTVSARASAASITLAWDPSSSTGTAGYIIEYGTSAAPFSLQVNVGNTTTWTFPDAVSGTLYGFRVRAYDSLGAQSAPSNEVWGSIGEVTTTTTTTTTTTSSCSTPDPFASLGGGTCYNGDWLPPGMAPPTSDPAPAPSPTPTTDPTSTGCSTPDPFASLGGGTCYNGDWLPPGMVPPSSSPTPAPSPTPTPTPTPAPSTTGCSTPDPFATIGGGTCYNGGWLPPGMPIPNGGTAPAPAPAPAPTPTPSPVPAPTGCTTPDPFATLGGGTCYNGGWLPPGMPVPSGGTTSSTSFTAPPPTTSSPTTCAGSDPFLGIPGLVGYCQNGNWLPIQGQAGTVRFSSSHGGWTVVGDDGVTYLPIETLDPALQVEGLRVFFAGVLEGTQSGVTLTLLVQITPL